MRASPFLAVLFASLVGSLPTSAQELLGSHLAGGGLFTPSDPPGPASHALSVPPAAPLVRVTLPPGDYSGARFLIDESHPSFAATVASLTDGLEGFFCLIDRTTGGSGFSCPFQRFLPDRFPACSTGEDFQGADIERIELTYELFVITGQAVATQVRIDVYGTWNRRATVESRPGGNPEALQIGPVLPVLGERLEPFVDHGTFAPEATRDYLILSPASQQLPTPFGDLLVVPGLPGGQVLQRPPGEPFSVLVPNDCSLVGTKLYLQGASQASGLQLTNALDLTLGVI